MSKRRRRDEKFSPIKHARHDNLNLSCDSEGDLQFNLFLQDISSCNTSVPTTSTPVKHIYKEGPEASCSISTSNVSISTPDSASFFEPLWVTSVNEESRLNVDEFCSLYNVWQRRFRVSDVATIAMLEVLRLCVPLRNNIPLNYNAVKKDGLLYLQNDFKLHVKKICRVCGSCIKNLCNNTICSIYLKKQRPSEYITVPLQSQLERIISRYGKLMLNYAAHSQQSIVSDLINSLAYDSCRPNPNGNSFMINLVVSCDGARLRYSRKGNTWPLTAQIVELPHKLRASYANILLLANFIGESKPNFEKYLSDSINEFIRLQNVGFTYLINDVMYCVKVRVFATILDLPARAAFWNCKQFNGRFGCMECVHPGVNKLNLTDKKCSWRWYPKFRINFSEKDSKFYTHAWNKINRQKLSSFYGIKEKPYFSLLCNPGNQNIIDFMHQMYEGIVKMLIHGIFGNDFRQHMTRNKWFIQKKFFKDIDDSLSNVRWPKQFTRTAPRITDLANYKALEYKNLFVYALLPITSGYFFDSNNVDFWHWLGILHQIIVYCCCDHFDYNNLPILCQLIECWQITAVSFLSSQKHTINMHLLQHLPKYLKLFGPLQNCSLFSFESVLSLLARLVTSANGSLQQVTRRFFEEKESFHWASTIDETKPIFHLVNKWYMLPSTLSSFPKLKFLKKSNYKLSQIEYNLLQPIIDVQHNSFDQLETIETKCSFFTIVHDSKKSNNWFYFRSDDTDLYGEIVNILRINGRIFILYRETRLLSTNIFSDAYSPSVPRIQHLYNEELYGKHFKKLKMLKAIRCIEFHKMFKNIVLLPITSNIFFVMNLLHDYEHN